MPLPRQWIERMVLVFSISQRNNECPVHTYFEVVYCASVGHALTMKKSEASLTHAKDGKEIEACCM